MAHAWLKSYLMDRKQKIDINGALSSIKTFNI
jgi:hypothetical protein